MNWTIVGFGRHLDKTLPQIIFRDPDWFFWAIEANVFKNKPHLQKEAEMLNDRACAVKIPDNNNGKLSIEHVIHRPTVSYARFDVVKADMPLHTGGSPTHRAKYLDFSFPRKFKGYDKSGCKLFLDSFKLYILKNPKARLTKKIAEDFFSDESNFVNP